MPQAQDWFAENAPKPPEPTEVGGYPIGTTVPLPRTAGRRLFVSPSQQAREEGTRTDYERSDNSVLGVPPELAVTTGIGLGRAAMGGGASLAERAYALAKASVDDIATPVAKYHAAKSVLQSLGAPPVMAESIAVLVSGLRSGRPSTPNVPTPKAAKAPATPSAATPSPTAPASPAASTPAASASAVPSGAPVSSPARSAGSTRSPQMIQNELGIQAARQKVKLTEPQYKAATDLVRQGKTPAEAVTEIASRTAAEPPVSSAANTSATSAPAPVKPPKGASRAKLTADEADEYLRLTGKGKTHEEAVEALMAQRKLAAKLGTPQPESVRRRVAERNVTGRWPEGEP